jgi:hypothetical protein
MQGCAEKHFQDGSVELQIPPLRYAPVWMIKGGVTPPFKSAMAEDKQQVPPLRFATVGMTFLLWNAPKNAFCRARTFHGNVVLPFVIPSEAEGSAV